MPAIFIPSIICTPASSKLTFLAAKNSNHSNGWNILFGTMLPAKMQNCANLFKIKPPPPQITKFPFPNKNKDAHGTPFPKFACVLPFQRPSVRASTRHVALQLARPLAPTILVAGRFLQRIHPPKHGLENFSCHSTVRLL